MPSFIQEHWQPIRMTSLRRHKSHAPNTLKKQVFLLSPVFPRQGMESLDFKLIFFELLTPQAHASGPQQSSQWRSIAAKCPLWTFELTHWVPVATASFTLLRTEPLVSLRNLGVNHRLKTSSRAKLRQAPRKGMTLS